MGDMTESSIPHTSQPRPPPLREDCWSEEATSTLVDAWGRRFMELNRGNLRQKDWQEVADAVNAVHGHSKKSRRTDVQCKNRIDTLKKKYKTEKQKIAESDGTLTSSWQFYSRLDALIGNNMRTLPQKASPVITPLTPASFSLPSPPMGVPIRKAVPPVTKQVLPQKRASPSADDSYFRRNYSAVAAAAAAAEEDVDEEEEELEEDREEREESEEVEGDGMKMLARAIERFGEIYERVEGMKQRQMVGLEKQRMQFAKDLEVQRMQLFMDTQVQLEKIKQAKRSRSTDDIYG